MPRRTTTTQRGYGHRHQQLREWWRPRVEAGQVTCWRCRLPIRPGEPWDLGHDDDRTKYRGPEHQDCNRGAAKQPTTPITPAVDPPAPLDPKWG